MEKYSEFIAQNRLSFTNSDAYPDYLGLGEKSVSRISALIGLFSQFQGCTFEGGLFRVHTLGSSYFWTKLTCGYFDNYKNKTYCFGFDWMGRQHAIDLMDPGKLYMFDAAVGEAFILKQTIEGFFNEELVDFKDDFLATETFNSLEEIHKNQLPFDKCLGFKIPLFLGGEEELDNYELMDIEVNWELNYQIYRKTLNLPEGTPIRKVAFE